MFTQILDLLIPVANIIDKNTPGFAVKAQEQINTLRDSYEAELAKPSDQINDGLLDSYNFQLQQLISLYTTSLQSTDATVKSS